MIVADSNLIASCVLESKATTAALALRARDPDWRVPHLWRYEVQNILATMIKAKRLVRKEAETIFQGLLASLRANEHEPHPADVLLLVEKHGISGYDAQFVALAQELGARLVTRDKELLKKLPDVATNF